MIKDIEIVGMLPVETMLMLKYLKETDTVLEYGSGGSTKFFPRFVKHYVSIEHDSNWYNTVSNEIKLRSYTNTELYYVPIHDIKFDDELDAQATKLLSGATDIVIKEGIVYNNSRAGFDWHCGIDYIKKPLSLPYTYDVVFVDGRCRPFCAYTALKLLNDNGYLIIHDYMPRKYYHGVEHFYNLIDCIEHHNYREVGAPTIAVFTKK